MLFRSNVKFHVRTNDFEYRRSIVSTSAIFDCFLLTSSCHYGIPMMARRIEQSTSDFKYGPAIVSASARFVCYLPINSSDFSSKGALVHDPHSLPAFTMCHHHAYIALCTPPLRRRTINVSNAQFGLRAADGKFSRDNCRSHDSIV